MPCWNGLLVLYRSSEEGRQNLSLIICYQQKADIFKAEIEQKRKELLQTSQASFKTPHTLTFKASLELQLLLGWDMAQFSQQGAGILQLLTTEPLHAHHSRWQGANWDSHQPLQPSKELAKALCSRFHVTTEEGWKRKGNITRA